MLTEIIPKSQTLPLSPAVISLPGYSMYTNFNAALSNLGASGTRGVGIYIRDSLKAVEISFPNCPFHEQLWVKVQLAGTDQLLIGCVYRSPSVNEDSITKLGDLLKHVADTSPSHLLVAGDFNVPGIDWENYYSPAPAGHGSHVLLEAIQDALLFQHVRQPTRYRQGNTPHILDLVLSIEEHMVRPLQYLPGIGHSDHIVLKFELECYSRQAARSRPRLDYNRGNYDELAESLGEVDWSVTNVMDTQGCHDYLKENMSQLVSRFVPLSRARLKKRNIYMDRNAMNLRKKKIRLWRTFVRTRCPLDYARFAVCKNELRALTRRLRREFEEDVAANIKGNPKRFWNYANSRLKTKPKIEDLRDDDGLLKSGDQDKANILNKFFRSVFTMEDTNDIPRLSFRHDGASLDDIDITSAAIEAKLSNLKAHSSPGPDGVHPRLLQELARPLSVPLSMLFRSSLDTGSLP